MVLVGGGAVVWEAHLVPNYRAYDMWLWPYRVAVEIDGAQHFVGRCYTTSAAAQATTDRKKEQAAVGERYHVARLHYKDSRTWCFTLVQALWAAKLVLHQQTLAQARLVLAQLPQNPPVPNALPPPDAAEVGQLHHIIVLRRASLHDSLHALCKLSLR